ncbi:repeat protein [Peptostreptococcaceae bacterium AS15]|nr:repeat protein [Peptostreptococcaceae bacterium AS15]
MKFKIKILCLICMMMFVLRPMAEIVSYANLGDSTNEREAEERERERQRQDQEQKERDFNVAVDISANFSELTADTKGKLTVSVKNTGGVQIAKPTLKATLPAELTLLSNTSPIQNLDAVKVSGDSVFVTYEVQVSKDAKTGNYPITFDFTGKYGYSVDNYKDYTYSKTFYVNIVKPEKKKKDEKQYKPFNIYNIKHPAIVNKGDIANLSFTISNPNDEAINSIKVTVAPDEGILNQSQGTFVENNFPAKGTKSYNIKLFPKDGAEKKNYSVKLTVEPTNTTEATPPANSENTENEPQKILPTATQYTGIFYNAPPKEEDEDKKPDGVKNPQIMITSYSYGGNPVQPNGQFPLSMTFVNTSKEKTLKNIKISLTADEGTFIAVGSSNSFYIDSMGPSASVTKTLNFSVKPDATTKTVGMNIDYSYEDTKANPLTAKDTISIPVLQKTLFRVDDVAQPQDVMEGEPVSISTTFYNLGKTQISNVKVTAKGDFTPSGSANYYLGTFEPGKSDSFSFSAIPNDTKKISGVIMFSYETLDGKTNTMEKKFNFELNPISMPTQPDVNPQPEKNSNNNLPLIIGGAVAALIVLTVVIVKIRAKKKKLQELELDE